MPGIRGLASRRVALLLAALLATLLAGCGGSRSHAHLWLTPGHAKRAYTACVSSDCGPWSVTLNWQIPAFPNTTGYWLFLNGTQVGSATSSPFTFYGWDCGASTTLGVEAHDGSGGHGPLWTLSYTAPACPAPTDPANFHVAQSAAGTSDGSSCANAAAVSTLSTVTHWTAGNVIGLCGTITSTIVAQASGSSGNPITVYWEPNASVQEPSCPVFNSGGCVNTNGKSFITLNGGQNGSILSTSNGTGLATQNDSIGVRISGCNGCTVENLNISQMYQPSTMPNSNTGGGNAGGMQVNASSNILIQNNTFADDSTGIEWVGPGANDTNIRFTGNYFHENNTSTVWQATQGQSNVGPVYFDHNNLDGWDIWDTGATDAHHLDGIHCYTQPNPSTPIHWTGVYIYDNRFATMATQDAQSDIFPEGNLPGTVCGDTTSDLYVFNNILGTSGKAWGGGNGPFTIGSMRPHIFNNTIDNGGSGGSRNGFCFGYSGSGGSLSTSGVVENNIVENCGGTVYDQDQVAFGTIDFNLYPNDTYWQWATQLTFPSWKTTVAGEANSSTPASAGLDSNYFPQAGSAALSAGTNLTSMCSGQPNPGLGALCFEYDGPGSVAPNTQRPTTGAWDAGAY